MEWGKRRCFVYSLTHVIWILKGSQNLFKLHEFSNYRSSSFFRPILLKKARRCIVQAKEEDKFYFMRNIYFAVNSYHKYCTETIINTIYCFGKKSVIEDCFILSSLLWLILLETFWRRGSNSESLANSVNLLRISIAPSTSFRDGGELGTSGASSLPLLIFSTVSAGCGRYFFNYFINWLPHLCQNQRVHQRQGFREPSLA